MNMKKQQKGNGGLFYANWLSWCNLGLNQQPQPATLTTKPHACASVIHPYLIICTGYDEFSPPAHIKHNNLCLNVKNQVLRRKKTTNRSFNKKYEQIHTKYHI